MMTAVSILFGNFMNYLDLGLKEFFFEELCGFVEYFFGLMNSEKYMSSSFQQNEFFRFICLVLHFFRILEVNIGIGISMNYEQWFTKFLDFGQRLMVL
jgi:hypothetical protein